jgi:hypothetical protein
VCIYDFLLKALHPITFPLLAAGTSKTASRFPMNLPEFSRVEVTARIIKT